MNRERNKGLSFTIFKLAYIATIILLVMAVMWPEPTIEDTSYAMPEVVEEAEEPVPQEPKEEKQEAPKETPKKEETTKKKKETKKTTNKSSTNYKEGFNAFITHYGPDCKGCSGTTASGYNVKNTIYYSDKEYGQVRVVATSKNIPLYTVIRISNYKKGSITAIVLDRGVSGNKIDVLVESERAATQLGIQKNAKVEILRWGK